MKLENIDMSIMEERAGRASAFLKGIASPHRLMILCQLVEGEKSVTELIEATDIAQTSVSQHLSKLRQEGLVTYRREHRTLYYRIDNPAVLNIMSVLYEEFCKEGE